MPDPTYPRWQETTPHPERARLAMRAPSRRGHVGCGGPLLLIAILGLALLPCAIFVL